MVSVILTAHNSRFSACTLNKVWLRLRICQPRKCLQIFANYAQFSMCFKFLHGLQQFWTVLVKFGQLLESFVFDQITIFNTRTQFQDGVNNLERFWTVFDTWKIFGTVEKFWTLLEKFGHCSKILDTVGKFWTSFENFG